jgi:enoyl-[acyl-carrier-protein] reductase (NADH)
MRPAITFWRSDVELIPQSKPLAGRKDLVVGIAHEHSITYGCAEILHGVGAELAIRCLTGDTHYIDGGFHILA